MSIGEAELLTLCAAGMVLGLVVVWPWSKIFSKAGYTGWLSVLMLVPLLNIGLIFWFGFSDWPNLNRNRV